jgi:hypothetical protein
MKKLFAICTLLIAITLPALAQGGRQLSSDDQSRFDNYYSRWQEYQRSNNRDEARSMEGRMQDIYNHYGIPSGVPYDRIASNGRSSYRGRDDHDRDDNRAWTGNRGSRQLSPDDQSRFNSYYSRWIDSRRKNDRDEARSMEGRMQDIYNHYGIRSDVPYDRIASNGGRDRDHDGDRDHDRY